MGGGEIGSASKSPTFPQLRNFLLVITEFTQYFIGVLTEGRR